MAQKKLPLEGVKVVEMGTVVAAPTTARVLCAYGAEVIKVETLDGDVMRLAGTHEFTPYEDDHPQQQQEVPLPELQDP